MSRLAGKRALVTGGSRGIGAAIARRLAAEGADVALTYERSADKAAAVVREIEALGRKGFAIAADSADPAAVTRAVDDAARALGGLDILVNNAGIYRGGPVADWSLADIDATLSVNVRAVVLASQAAAAHLGEGGRIISTGSCLADRVVEPNVTLYAMSKAALIGFTKGLARDLGPRGITVNIVHPGSTDTDMNPAGGPGADAQRARMAIPRYGQPEDIAGLVAYLASEEARFITGAGFAIDGGVNT
ncbi:MULTISPECIES: SDR family NAD(P)-dependent oxidoreductase [Bosea]|uniref:SDR family NAD(P)-dependent oxidoreductase n=1 Tax=Bosea TaxID=85413 RepID=UPI00214FF56A|nr:MULTISPECIES: 3-oxoacyl-ACP reductase family protein [Bosea]MCR4523313.1 3-oxoacyl-ACP reductase FabG [Bosea sp. 47.2.35]MDR6828614.1 NAD(P)-dependent dehydrogenase (short-subunit alcohol dehydrogenase family) [Bosea robiniae]MDR6895273.1 NAD(P)-dependent dehydrogenase (short-subunit alcohol dehydrogenase family) [Bosea sp. BE109]MDR7138669.1 NAD(P)-dependent dehydrogenase (short-subunit alcohol dehydrogenase family) [Bosea sp. BE168]MDR7175356.1 NAD(P)-dependent dehydrogenase (short-subuni